MASTIKGIFFNNRNHSIIPLEIFNEVFDTPFYVEYYENVFNTFNYIQNTLYKCLAGNNNLSKEEFLKDYYQKQYVAYDNLKDIVEYLNSIDNEGALKSSICNDMFEKVLCQVVLVEPKTNDK